VGNRAREAGGDLMALLSKPCLPRPELEALLKKATENFRAMTPEQQAALLREHRKSWVIGEMMLEHPEMTREQAEALYDKVAF
jgi:hypothetical protein